jgi:hypothetical protein
MSADQFFALAIMAALAIWFATFPICFPDSPRWLRICAVIVAVAFGAPALILLWVKGVFG